jgi:serine phosphatase RsbU (regulator of sigma subunit)
MKLINSTLDLDELLTVIMKEITENLDADRSTLYIVDEDEKEIWSKIAQGDKKLEIRQPIGKGISGYVAQTGKAINIKDAYLDKRFNPNIDKRTGYRTRSILCMPVYDKSKRVIAVLQILNKKHGEFSEEDEIFTSAFADYISLAIQNAQLYQEALERKKLENEIALAGEIQRMLLPEKLPLYKEYEIFAFHQPSRQIGGDYYDFIPNSTNLYLILADVSGKGIPAALLMANLQATTRNLLGKNQSNLDLVNSINKHLFSVTTSDKYATLVWGEIDTHSHIFHYITAGHIPPIHFTQKKHEIIHSSLSHGGIPVGMMSDVEFDEGEVGIEPHDMILICSDGITEAQDKYGNMFEESRIINIVKENFDRDIQYIGENIIQQVKDFSKKGIYDDDITLLLIRRTTG